MTRLLIIGGSDAGISAALRAKELDKSVNVTVVVADSFPNYSICGIPFYLSGEVPDWRNLAHRTAEEIAETGINLLLNHTAQSVAPAKKSILVVDRQGQVQWLSYDKLVIGTGAVPVKPPIQGLDLPGVFLLHSMEDTFAVHQYLTTYLPQSAVIVGGGYIGLEMADALTPWVPPAPSAAIRKVYRSGNGRCFDTSGHSHHSGGTFPNGNENC